MNAYSNRINRMRKIQRKSNESETGTALSTQSIVLLLLGLSVGHSLCSAWTSGQFLQTQLEQSKNILEDAKQNKMSRFWKYTNTYRYISPASRYDYIPVPAKECGASPDFEPWWKQNKKSRSRFGEDKFIYETFFKYQQPTDFKGTYVELGAFDGQIESNTRFFDVCLGWKGLLIEGNPANYQKTVQNRHFAHRMSLAPSCSAEYEAANKTIQFYRYPQTNVGLVDHAKTYQGQETVDVPCGPLSPILEDIFEDDRSTDGVDLATLDFFSLDVEGAESLVLSTVDFQAIRINVLMIEVKNVDCKEDCPNRRKIREKMAAEGYKRYEELVRASDIYVHPESPFQISESIAVPT